MEKKNMFSETLTDSTADPDIDQIPYWKIYFQTTNIKLAFYPYNTVYKILFQFQFFIKSFFNTH